MVIIGGEVAVVLTEGLVVDGISTLVVEGLVVDGASVDVMTVVDFVVEVESTDVVVVVVEVVVVVVVDVVAVRILSPPRWHGHDFADFNGLSPMLISSFRNSIVKSITLLVH